MVEEEMSLNRAQQRVPKSLNKVKRKRAYAKKGAKEVTSTAAVLSDEQFAHLERAMEKKAVETSKALFATLQFHMLASTVDEKTNKKTLAGLKEFRKKNWDAKKTTDKNYKAYLKKY